MKVAIERNESTQIYFHDMEIKSFKTDYTKAKGMAGMKYCTEIKVAFHHEGESLNAHFTGFEDTKHESVKTAIFAMGITLKKPDATLYLNSQADYRGWKQLKN
jgi:hypothetical protein